LRCFGGCGGESVALEVRYKYPFHTLSDYVRILVLESMHFFDCIPYVSYFSVDTYDSHGLRGLQRKNTPR
ncbi:hypothetical protein BMETH_2244227436365, partial [methanotrophic bacterial endosymbiont of Bathymodiolus sp.]